MRYYKIEGGAYVLDTEFQVNLVGANVRRSAQPKNNVCDITLNNPIVDFFSDGTPRRRFVDETGANIFKAAKKDVGYDSFEEKIELFAKDVSDISEDIVNDDNLIFSGQIKDAEFMHEEKRCSVKLTISDRTFNIMNRIWSNSYESVNYAEIIQNIIRQVTEDNSAYSRGGFDTSGTANNGPYLIDARTFTEGAKTGSESVTGISGKTLTCSGATFVADGVSVGDVIKNEVNYKTSLVKEVVSETELKISKGIFEVGDTIVVSDGFIQDWRPDGTVFPDITFGMSKKPAIEWISELVQVENTNTPAEQEDGGTLIVKRPLKYYVDGANRFHAFYPDDTPSVEIKMTSTTPQGEDTNTYITYKSKMKKGIFDVLNYIIYTCGEDMNDQTFSGFAQDPSRGGPNIKDCGRNFPKVSWYMKLQDYFAGNIAYVSGTTFNYPTSYPMTPSWSREGTSVANDSEYNTAFREEGRLRGSTKAMAIINESGTPRWKGNCELGFYNFNPSDLVKFTDTDMGIREELVRIKEVQHNIGDKGFFTTLTLEEDLPEAE